jgi:hypothetical protein
MAVRFRISGLFPSQPSPLGDSPALPTAADVAGRVVSVLVKFDQRPNHSLMPKPGGVSSEVVALLVRLGIAQSFGGWRSVVFGHRIFHCDGFHIGVYRRAFRDGTD